MPKPTQEPAWDVWMQAIGAYHDRDEEAAFKPCEQALEAMLLHCLQSVAPRQDWAPCRSMIFTGPAACAETPSGIQMDLATEPYDDGVFFLWELPDVLRLPSMPDEGWAALSELSRFGKVRFEPNIHISGRQAAGVCFRMVQSYLGLTREAKDLEAESRCSDSHVQDNFGPVEVVIEFDERFALNVREAARRLYTAANCFGRARYLAAHARRRSRAARSSGGDG